MRYQKNYFLLFMLPLFLFSLAGSVYSQPTWVWQNPYPNAHTIKSVYFLDTLNGFAAGEYGCMMKTTNGGMNWTVYSTGYTDDIYSVIFINPLTGYAAGGNNYLSPSSKRVYKTTNGGINWTSVSLGTSTFFTGIDFINANTGIATGNYQEIYYTTNGGINWNSVNGAGVLNYCVDVVNASTAFIGSSGGIIQKTTNGGANWTSSVVAGTNSVTSISFADTVTGYAVGSNNTVLKTTNSGTNWFTVAPSNFSYQHRSVSFINASTGMIAGDGGKILVTTNGGVNWSLSMPAFYGFSDYYACKFISPGVLYAFGLRGSKVKSSNGGLAWENLMPVKNTGIFSSYFLNASTGWASENGSIKKTTNGGLNWISSDLNITNNIAGLTFINASTGFAIAAYNTNGEYLKTTNGGTNWGLTPGIAGKTLFGFDFVNSTTGYLYGSYEVFKTTNSGNNWILVDSTGSSVIGMKFADVNTGYVARYSSSSTVFRKTTNGGLNWTTTQGSLSNCYAGYFKLFGTDTLYAFGNNNFYKSVNGGDNWSNEAYISMTVQTGFFMDQTNGFIAGLFGYLKRTTNGGASWESIPSGTANSINSMYINGLQMWIMGEGSSILKSSDLITQVRINGEEAAKDFRLFQNYPNPFNPETKIDFSVPENSFVNLAVYNILGQKMRTLVNEHLNSGRYTSVFDGSSLPSGVYFYKLETGKYSEIRKMILLK